VDRCFVQRDNPARTSTGIGGQRGMSELATERMQHRLGAARARGSGEDAGLPADEYLARANLSVERACEQTDGEEFAAPDIDHAARDYAVERH
jgi:hypothetical protein